MTASPEHLSVDAVAALGAHRLAAIVTAHAAHDRSLREDLRLALLAAGPVDPFVAALGDALDAVAVDGHTLDDDATAVLARDLERLRLAITRHLLPRAPAAAAALLDRFLRLDAAVFARCNDVDGAVADVFRAAVHDCGRVWLALPDRDPRHLAEAAFALFAGNDHGVRDDIIPAVRDALGPAGLDALEGMIRNRLAAPSSDSASARDAELLRALIEIADARGDLDGYIALHEMAGTEDGAIKEICERLIAAGRLDEALERAEGVAAPQWRRDELDRLRIEILDGLGRRDAAQALRREHFARTLSPTILDDLLAALPEADRPAACADAVAVAGRHGDVHRALERLCALDPGAAATLVRQRLGEINPQLYRVVRPIAERLAPHDPLAAVLIHRRLAEHVLETDASAGHPFAVRDLAAADALADAVADWDGHPTAAAYRRDIAARHRQKRAFWDHMRGAGLDWR